MKKVITKAKKALERSSIIIKDDGVVRFTNRVAKYAYYRKFPERKKQSFKDILFINGCELEAPTWYRVNHQMEQLIANGLTADSVFYDALSLDMLKRYRGFVFFRCPITDTVREFIKQAKYFNKTCFFDIDDLVIDTKYTNQIDYVANMPKADKALYDDGVNRMQETLRLCDYAITTTQALKAELENYTKEVFINRNVASDEIERFSLEALQTVKRDENKVILGYFSGSITHNEDFEMIIPSLVKILKKYPHVCLKITGILDIPSALEPYQEQIIADGKFYNQREFPALIASCDVALAPLTDKIFNAAKSENKWLLPALVKVPTLASNLGAFAEAIEDGKTGVLVDDDNWYEALERIIIDKTFRESVAENAFKKATTDYITTYSGNHLATYIRGKLARNIGIVLPSTDISGGVIVAVKHADILRRHGWDVTLIDAVSKHALKVAKKTYEYRYDLPGFNVLTDHKTKFEGFFDTQVATLWSTVKNIKENSNVRNRIYFVQNYETDFYTPGTGDARFLANASYNDQSGVRYATMSLWCQEWLKTRFGKVSRYASNGIDIENYPFKKRSFEGKIKLLVEGDSKSEYKNTDEAFRIIEKLDPKKYEVSYLSYRKEPKDWYRVDHFYNRIAPEEVGKVYASCDILIKTSILESFSYPPLEMMATGGISVVVPNGGNVEYLRDGENCLFYKQGGIDAGVAAVEKLVNDAALRKKIVEGGLKTAQNYTWDKREKDVVALYE